MAYGFKTGGRQKGVGNKTKIPRIAETLAEQGFSPIEKLIQLATTSDEESIQLSATKELCRYCYPQLKSIEAQVEITEIPTAFKIKKA